MSVEPKIIWLECSCHMCEHAMKVAVYRDDDDTQVYVSLHLKDESVLQRLKNAVKYVLYGRRDFPIYGEILLDNTELSKLKEVLNNINGSAQMAQE